MQLFYCQAEIQGDSVVLCHCTRIKLVCFYDHPIVWINICIPCVTKVNAMVGGGAYFGRSCILYFGAHIVCWGTTCLFVCSQFI